MCNADVEPDGLVFDSDTVRAEEIREGQEYGGLRVSLMAFLERARIPLQVDVGFGDTVSPGPRTLDYPVLTDLPAPRIWTYPQETVVAEKVQAMVALGLLNSRMKDFYDVYKIARNFAFEGDVLAAAIRATFDRRGTPIPKETPPAFTEEFAAARDTMTRWASFLRRTGLTDVPKEFRNVVLTIRDFAMPMFSVAVREETSPKRWNPDGPWI